MTLSLLPHPLAWGALARLPHAISTHARSPPPHDLPLLATLDGEPSAAFLLRARDGSLHCVASASLDIPERPLLFCSLIPYARSTGASSLLIRFPLRPPHHALGLTPSAYAQQVPFDPELLTPTLGALLRAGATPAPGWAHLPHGLILACVSLDAYP